MITAEEARKKLSERNKIEKRHAESAMKFMKAEAMKRLEAVTMIGLRSFRISFEDRYLKYINKFMKDLWAIGYTVKHDKQEDEDSFYVTISF